VANSSSPTNLRQLRRAGCWTLRKPRTPCIRNAILHEIRQLCNVSDRLDLLAEQHPLVSDAFIGISGRIRKHGDVAGGGGRGENADALRLRSSKCLSRSLVFERSFGISTRKLVVENESHSGIVPMNHSNKDGTLVGGE
jgi:hypothetical protein